MSVDVSGLVAAIDQYALDTWECVGSQMESDGQQNAPEDSGAMADSVQWSGASGGGGSVTGTLVVGESYAWFTTQEVLEGHPVMVFESGGETVFAHVVHPTNPNWWQQTLDSFPDAVGGCG